MAAPDEDRTQDYRSYKVETKKNLIHPRCNQRGKKAISPFTLILSS